MGRYLARPSVDEDLIAHADWIKQDNPQAARKFLDPAFESFELLAQFPEAGPKARLKPESLKNVRFWVLHPPFSPRSASAILKIGSCSIRTWM
jgi:plasmid stabilization system protein ParE